MFLSAIVRLINKIGLKALIGFAFLLFAMSSVAYGLGEINSGLNSRFLTGVAFWALLLSWVLARTRAKGWVATGLLILAGLGLVFINVGQLWGPIWSYLRALDFRIGVLIGRITDVPPDLNYYNYAYNEVYFQVTGLATTWWEWVLSLVYGPPFFSKPAISLSWGWLVWGLASWAGWFYRRRRSPVMGLLPASVLLAAGLSYTWASTAPLAPLVFSVLLLLALTNYDHSERHWLAAKMDFPEDLPKEFSLLAAGVVTGVVGIAIILPIFSFDNLVEIAQKFTQASVEDAEPVIQSLGVYQKPIETTGLGNALSGGLPRRHLLGTGPELTEQIVMSVKVTGAVSEQENDLNLPLYWRSLTYEEYTGFGWRSEDYVLRSYDAGDQVLEFQSPHHQAIQQDFRLANANNRNLYAAGDIVTVDHDFEIGWRATIRLTDIHDAPGEFFGAAIEEPVYRVQSLIPIVSETELRAASGPYPSWISEWYLSLPDSLPNRVGRLANELTGDDATTYDKVRSLETYLRTYEYTLDLELPPIDRDMVDYFLFTLKKGYCDYYASSMVVLARSLGIPARLAIGYYRGNYDTANQRYIVTEADSHSWVEIYFQGIGWVPFEPTAGRAALDHFAEEEEIQAVLENDISLRNLTPLLARIKWSWQVILSSGLGGLMIIILGFAGIDRWRIYRLTAPAAVEHLYQRLYSHGRRLKITTRRESTPQEFSAELKTRLQSLAQTPFWERRLTPAHAEIETFTQVYSQLLYSPATVNMQDRPAIITLWRRLRRRLWLARLRQLTYRKRKEQITNDANE